MADDAPLDELLEVRAAAESVGRHPETVRRWVWSGRLASTRKGNRVLVARRDVEALASPNEEPLTFAAWVAEADAAHEAWVAAHPGREPRSAVDLVLEDRRRHFGEDWPDPSR